MILYRQGKGESNEIVSTGSMEKPMGRQTKARIPEQFSSESCLEPGDIKTGPVVNQKESKKGNV